ncbi:hypothetical protein JR316_0011118 [Psilocybe cubensis]|nr:hypothetical protein JR316_0011118 [Psilocybe cubensis]KAH9477199.1 hypothetical protein JR316_0011118 [Psilocybe cubensis]
MTTTTTDTPSLFLRTLIPTLPTGLSRKIRTLCTASPANEHSLENLLRFVLGAECQYENEILSTNGGNEKDGELKDEQNEQWKEKQGKAREVVAMLIPPAVPTVPNSLTPMDIKKRPRSDKEEEEEEETQKSKKQRLSGSSPVSTPLDPGAPIFALHALSTTSPLRKKLDITIHTHGIVLTHPTTRVVETCIPFTTVKRAFVLPTRGKQKPHWTVVVMGCDAPVGKGKGKEKEKDSDQQLIFGLDALTANATAFSFSTYSSSSTPATTVLPKSTPTLPTLLQFLTHLPAHATLIRPSTDVFKSACPGMGHAASTSSVTADASINDDDSKTGRGARTKATDGGAAGVPGIEAHRSVKPGTLWFAREGILWGESRPCEFWAVEDLCPMGGPGEGVKIVGAGRTCSVILSRWSTSGEEEEVDETEFSMVDAKEREGISAWVRTHRHLFGGSKDNTTGADVSPNGQVKKIKSKSVPTGPITIRTMDEDSDSDDESFAESGASDLDGSESDSDSNSSSSDEDKGEDEQGEEEEESDNENKGSGASRREEEEEDSEIEELDPVHHPLLRPGAMPKRISKAALDMVVGIVEGEFTGQGEEEDELDEDGEEEDELNE